MDKNEILLELKKYEVIPCDMIHEVVLKKEDDLIRNNLCNKSIRAYRLGCAHSKSNHNFLILARSLSINFPEAINQINKLENVITEVYQLDHRKGELEKALFLLKTVQKNTDTICLELNKTTEKHRELIYRISELKSIIIQELEQ